MDARSTIIQALAEAARTNDDPPDLDRSLRSIAEVAQSSIPGIEHASITLLHPDGRLETRASTNPLVLGLDNIQYLVDEGPCLDTVRGQRMVSAPRMRDETRWPSYAPRAASLGVQSQLSVKLCLDVDSPLGGLNLYSTTTEHVAPESEAMAELFGCHPATGPRNGAPPGAPSPALKSLAIIGQALGIVMDRFDLDANRAFDHLDEAAAQADLGLGTYAQQLLDQGGSR